MTGGTVLESLQSVFASNPLASGGAMLAVVGVFAMWLRESELAVKEGEYAR